MDHLVERNGLTSNNIRWDASKVKQIIWHTILELHGKNSQRLKEGGNL